jgi:DNA replication protein DnaC
LPNPNCIGENDVSQLDSNRRVDAMRFWRDANIPERHKAKTRDRHTAEGLWADTYRRLSEMMDMGPLVVLVGARGTGKTQMAVDLLADICNRAQAVRYCKAMDLFREIRDCFGRDRPRELEVVDRFCRYAGLVIDEAHERSDSECENRTLTNIIDRRYDAMRTTILISNLTKEVFAQAVGPSIVSRVTEAGEVVTCDWPSFRMKGGAR